LRTEAAMTQERLAWDSDLDKGYVSQVEAGLRLPSLPALAALAQTLGATTADVVGFDLRSPRLRVLDAMRRGDVGEVEQALAVWRRANAKGRAS
jgi:transcriptional regulator with XRE-family HTH domain